MIPSAIPVTIDIPRISFILLRRKNTVLKMAIIPANRISRASIFESNNVIPVKAAVIPIVIKPNFIISFWKHQMFILLLKKSSPLSMLSVHKKQYEICFKEKVLAC